MTKPNHRSREVAGAGRQATPAPPVGTALGPRRQHLEFVKQFHAKTGSAAGMVTPVVVTIYKDRTFTFVTKTRCPVLLKKKRDREGSATSTGRRSARSRAPSSRRSPS